MRIPCPYCGLRSNEEFTYYGDATLRRPDFTPTRGGTEVDAPVDPESERAVHDYVYLRNNPAGLHRELWFHAAGCHTWLVVERDTRTHAIASAAPARTRSAGNTSDQP